MSALEKSYELGSVRLIDRMDEIDFHAMRESYRKHILTEVGIGSGFISDMFLQSRDDQHTAQFIDLVIDKLGSSNLLEIAEAMCSDKLDEFADEFRELHDSILQPKVIHRAIHKPSTLKRFDYSKVDMFLEEVEAPHTRYTQKLHRTLLDIRRLCGVITRDGRSLDGNKRINKLEAIVNDEMRYTRIYDEILTIAKTMVNDEERLFMNEHCAVEIIFHDRGGLVAIDFSKVGSLDTTIVGGYAFDQFTNIEHGEPIYEVIRGMLAKGGDVLNFPASESDRPLFGMRDVTDEKSMFAF